jgi:serine/threonine-protein kinase HipA
MRYCPITYDLLETNELYSAKGLRQLSSKLKTLEPLSYSAQEQRTEAINRATKLSIQGVQPKLSATLDINQQTFAFVDQNGAYILKPESDTYPELPANEAISMSLAERFNIEVPLHGLVFTKDEDLTYFIKRFDRINSNKIAMEDFAQLSCNDRDTKYNSSIEKVVKVIDEFVTFPQIEHVKLFRRILFNFVIGNEDMHLKNYSLIKRNDIWQLAPAYDFLNTTIALKNPAEESALPINGKKNKLKREDFIDYLAIEHLKLTTKIIDDVMAELNSLKPIFIDLIERSYMTSSMKEAYVRILGERYSRLFV